VGKNVDMQGPQSGSGGGDPKPKGGEVEKSCQQNPNWRVGWDFTPEELKKMREQNSSPLKYFAPGAGPFNFLVADEFQGEVMSNERGRNPTGDSGPAVPDPTQEQGGQAQRGTTDDPKNRLKKGFQGTVEKVTASLKGPISKADVILRDPKVDTQRKKIDKRYKDFPADSAVKDLIAAYLPGVSDVYVEDFSTVVIEDIRFNEVFLNTAFNRLALLANAQWHIDENSNFWFYQPESHVNPEPITSDTTMYYLDPAAAADKISGGVGVDAARAGAGATIKKGTAKVTLDGEEIINKVEVFNPKKEVPRQETPTGEGDEKHFSYPPVPDTFYVYESLGNGYATVPVYEDWLDRPNVDPWDAPQYTGPAVVHGVTPTVAWLNEKEKIFRLTTSATVPVAKTPGVLLIEYDYYQPQFVTMYDSVSIEQYGLREFRFVTPAGHSYQEMVALGEGILREYSQPRLTAEAVTFGNKYNLGQTVRFFIPEWDLDVQLPIWKVNIRFDMKNLQRFWPGESHISMGKRPQTLDKYLAQYIENRITALEEPYFEKHVPYEDIFVYRENITFYESYNFPFTP